MTGERRRDILIVAVFTLLIMAPFWAKAYHIDEPFFLDLARQILRRPGGPLPGGAASDIGAIPWPRINNNPPLLLYLLAGALRATGGGELPMRLAFFPLDLVAALSLYLLAARFLARPLLPTLIVLSSPAYLVNMNHLMTEKLAAAFGFAALYALVRGCDEDSPGWQVASALLLDAALLSKYLAVFLLPVAAFFLWSRGASARRIAGYCGLAVLGLGGFLVRDLATGGAVLRGVGAVSSGAAHAFWSHWSHRTRSFLACAGGCSAGALAWPLLAAPGSRRRTALWAAAAAVAAALFSPWLDLAPGVRIVDRLMGAFFAWGAVCCFAQVLAGSGRVRGGGLWAAWLVSAGVLTFSYWSIMARTVLFLLPPMVFSGAAGLEPRLPRRALTRLYGATLAVTLSLALAVAWVDWRYAGAQKAMAAEVTARYLTQGRRVWCAAHLGLRHYLLESGAREMDGSQASWDRVGRGDVVVSSRTNLRLAPPRRPLLSNVLTLRVDCALPLRLISGWGGEGGFYSSISGFLPFTISREPLEEFVIIEVL